MKPRITHEEFIKKLDKVHPNREWEVVGKYVFNKTPILLRDKYGDCLISPTNLLQKSSPSVKTAVDKTAYTVEKFTEVWGEDIYDYSKFKYKGAKIKSTIICKKEGHEFMANANSHLSKNGCPQCAKEGISARVRSNTKEFVEKAIKKHGKDLYSYEKTDYVTATEEVIITCKKHGDFEQTPNRFLNGQVCPRCYVKQGNYYTSKIKRGVSIFYIIECFNKEERFLKMGVTSRSIKERFRDDYDMPYNYKILRKFEYANIDASDALEIMLLDFTKTARYTPSLFFNGRTETRELHIKDKLLDFVDSITDHFFYQAFINFIEVYDGVLDKEVLYSGTYTKIEIESILKGYHIHLKIESGLYDDIIEVLT